MVAAVAVAVVAVAVAAVVGTEPKFAAVAVAREMLGFEVIVDAVVQVGNSRILDLEPFLQTNLLS